MIGLLVYQFREAQEAAEPGVCTGSTQAKSVDRRGFDMILNYSLA
jgi:hypothetical protein